METNEEDPTLVRRMRTLLRLRYLYICLRMYRPLLILGLSMSQDCPCTMDKEPHLDENEAFSLDAPSCLGAIRECAIKRVAAAEQLHALLRDWVERLSSKRAFDGACSAVENLQYFYACGLVFIAARMTPFVINAMGPKNGCVPQLERAFNEICILMGKYDLPGQPTKDSRVKRQFSGC